MAARRIAPRLSATTGRSGLMERAARIGLIFAALNEPSLSVPRLPKSNVESPKSKVCLLADKRPRLAASTLAGQKLLRYLKQTLDLGPWTLDFLIGHWTRDFLIFLYMSRILSFSSFAAAILWQDQTGPF